MDKTYKIGNDYVQRCGRFALYVPSIWAEDSVGVFRFLSEDCQAVCDELGWSEETSFPYGHLRRWLLDRAPNEIVIGQVPPQWSHGFETVAGRLMRDCRGVAFCTLCGRVVASPDISPDDLDLQPGWNYDTYLCPEGHSLLKVRVFHIQLDREPPATT